MASPTNERNAAEMVALAAPASEGSSSRTKSPLARFRVAAKTVACSLQMLKESRRRTFVHADAQGKLPFRQKLIYAAPSFSLLSLTMLITIHSILFYESIGTSLSRIAFFTVLARSFDVITDPFMGWYSDSTRSKWGRRRPYIAFGCWGYAIAFFAFMSPPSGLSRDGNGYWFGITHIVFYLFDTIANVPYTAWGPELTDSPRERENVFFFRGLFDKIGVLAGAAGPAIVGGMGFTDRETFQVLAAFFGIYYVTTMMILLTNQKEREKSMKTRAVPLVPSVLRAFKNVAFRPLLVGWVLDYMALGMLTSMFPFFIRYVVLDPGFNCVNNEPTALGMKLGCDADVVLGTSLGLLFIASGVGMPIWKKLSARYGKRNVWLAYNIVNSISNITFFWIDTGDVGLLYLCAFLNGVPVGGQFLIEAILSDVIDYDEFLNGTRSEGSFTVFATFIPKVVSIPSSAIPLAILAASGFIPTVKNGNELISQPQSSSVKSTIRIIFIIIPSVATLVSFWIKTSFPIRSEKIVAQISTGILAHEGRHGAFDPITGADDVHILDLTDEQQNKAWLLDNFAWDTLVRFAEPGVDASHNLVRVMSFMLAMGTTLLIFFMATVAFTFELLSDDAWAWLPSFACIMAGMALCFTVVTALRLQAAYALEAMDPPPDELARLIIAHKKRGQRGGDAKATLFEGGTLQKMRRSCV